jgi:TetR/AcrR family tetracycline transcriptional repressor
VDVDARREEIVRAAIDLLDDVGFDALSLRQLAVHLRMHAPGLYWYVESKQDLIDRMADRIMAEGMNIGPLAPGQTWDAWLVELACTARRALLAHRDGARVVASAFLVRTSAITPVLEQALEILEGAGFDSLIALGVTITLMRYATGIALDEQLSPLKPAADDFAVRAKVMASTLIDPERWPRVADAYRQVFNGEPRDREKMFRWGAQMIVRGFDEMVRDHRRSHPSGGGGAWPA